MSEGGILECIAEVTISPKASYAKRFNTLVFLVGNGGFQVDNLAKFEIFNTSADRSIRRCIALIRQVVALVCGLLWGAIPLVGGIWIVV
ncbi:hypothetical protein C3L33_06990, partial [Rhododendron williamsianum]